MRQNSDSTVESPGFELRELRRIITRHRRRHEQAERKFQDWQRSLSLNERVREAQLTRIGNQLMDRLQNGPVSNGEEGVGD